MLRDCCNIKTGPALALWSGIQMLQSEDHPMQDIVTQCQNIRIDDKAAKKFSKSCQKIRNRLTPQKKEPYNMSPAAARVNSKVQNLDLPLVVTKDIENLTIEEKIHFINQVPEHFKFNCEVVESGGIVMPLNDREVAKTQIMSFFKNNVSWALERNTDKIYHMISAVFGGSGSGKTRICKEIMNWFKDFAKEQPEITSYQAIYIDFSNGHGVSYDEEGTAASLILGQRVAAEVLYNSNFKELRDKLKNTNLLGLYDFNTVMEAIRLRMNPEGGTAILLILDEFNYVFKLTRAVADNIIRQLGDYMTLGKKRIFFPVIAGTVEGQVSQSFVNSGYNRVEISLPPLSFTSIESIFMHCLPEKEKWLDFVPFRRLLLLMCSTPRALHAVLTSLKNVQDEPTLDNIEVLGLDLLQKLSFSVSHSVKMLFDTPYFIELMQFVLAGTNFKLIETKTELIERLEIQGILYRRGEHVFLPYHIIYNCNAAFGQYQSVQSLKPLVPPQLIPLPGVRYTWQMFELLDHSLDPVKVAATSVLMPKARINELFKGVICRPSTGNQILQLTPLKCVTESEQFISKKKPGVLKSIRIANGEVVGKDDVFDYAFLCKTGNPLVDARLFFRTRNAKPIMLVKQLKHLERVEMRSTITFEYVKEWHEKTKKTLSNMNRRFDILFMFITNKTITNIPEVWPKDLLLVHSENIEAYYGPFVAQLHSN